MDLFTVLPDYANLGTGVIDATHTWFLPGVTCPHCGSTWGNVGLEYPAIDLSSLPDEKKYRRSSPVGLSEFARLREPIAQLMRPDALLLPGTHFGPLVGKGKDRFADFAWVNLWTLLATAENLAWLRDRVPNLNGVTPKLTFGSGDHPTLLELQLEPEGEVGLPSVNDDIQQCVECGRDPRPLPDQILIARSSIPANLHLFRARNFTTIVLATDRFVEAVQHLGLLGLRFEEVEISD